MSKEFKNEDRRRYYGLKVGDIVTYFGKTYKVYAFDIADNNRVGISGDSPFKTDSAVAELCDIVVKEDENPLLELVNAIIEPDPNKEVHVWCINNPEKAKNVVAFCALYGSFYSIFSDIIAYVKTMVEQIESNKVEQILGVRYSNQRHMCLSLEGCLRNYKRRKINIFQDDNGKFISDKEARKYIAECMEKGWRVIPMGECSDFDYQTGCKGHLTGAEIIKNTEND